MVNKGALKKEKEKVEKEGGGSFFFWERRRSSMSLWTRGSVSNKRYCRPRTAVRDSTVTHVQVWCCRLTSQIASLGHETHCVWLSTCFVEPRGVCEGFERERWRNRERES